MTNGASEKKPPVLAVVGATASGKTALGIALAKAYQGEVVSADSMQLYEGLDIATAKPTEAEMEGIPSNISESFCFSISFFIKFSVYILFLKYLS